MEGGEVCKDKDWNRTGWAPAEATTTHRFSVWTLIQHLKKCKSLGGREGCSGQFKHGNLLSRFIITKLSLRTYFLKDVKKKKKQLRQFLLGWIFNAFVVSTRKLTNLRGKRP